MTGGPYNTGLSAPRLGGPACTNTSLCVSMSPCLTIASNHASSSSGGTGRHYGTSALPCSINLASVRFKDCSDKTKFYDWIGAGSAVVVWCHAYWNRGFPSSNLNRPLTRSLHLWRVSLCGLCGLIFTFQHKGNSHQPKHHCL